MNSYSILNGSRMKEMSSAAISMLNSSNSELEIIRDTYVNIGSNSEVQGEAAENMKQHMTDYRDVIDSMILANESDIADHNVVLSTLDDQYYDGALIIQEENNALAEKSRDEVERDRCYREWMDGEWYEFLYSSYYYYRYLWFCHEVNQDEKEYQKWLAKENKYDELDAATAGLFTTSSQARNLASSGLTSLSGALTGGNYNADALISDWREKMADILAGIWEYYDNGAYSADVQKILDDMSRVEAMTEMEYLAYVSELEKIGIEVPEDVDKSKFEEYVKQYLETKMYSNLEDPITGERVSCPFNELSFEERSLYVLMFEKDSENAAYVYQMNLVSDAFEDDGYEGWEKDIANIKFMAYTAEEPYRSFYINHVNAVHYGDLHSTEWPHHSSGSIYINVDDFDINNVESYVVFFHESGHNIDYSLGWATLNYTQGLDETTLMEMLETDVRETVNSEIDNWLSQGEYKYLPDDVQLEIKKIVEDCIMNEIDIETFGKPDFSLILGDDSIVDPELVEKCYDKVVENIKNDMTSMASDAYGGFTGNTLAHGGYHPAIYASGGGYRVYWIQGDIDSENGTGLVIVTDDGESHTIDISNLDDESQRSISELDEEVIISQGNVIYQGSPAKELLAEDLAANITGCPKDINGLEFFDDETLDFLNDLYEDANNGYFGG